MNNNNLTSIPKTDEEKYKLLFSKTLSTEETIKIIHGITNEQLKINLLMQKILTDAYDKLKIIRNFKSDKNKIQALKLLPANHQLTIIKTLSSDEYKLEALKRTQITPLLKIEIIKSLNKDEIKLQAIKEIKILDKRKVEIINTFTSEEFKIKALKEIDLNDGNKLKIIMLLSDINKLKCINLLNGEIEIIIVLLSLSDKNKIVIIQNIPNENIKLILICSLKDNELKKELLKDKIKYKDLGLNPLTTIGIEIETEGPNSSKLKEYRQILPNWPTKEDQSLKNSGLEGVEITSPILHNDLDSIASIYGICKLLNEFEQTVSPRCGAHIHIGANALTTKQSYINLIEIWCNVEEIIYLISNKEGELPRPKIYKFARSYSSVFSEIIEEGSINLETEQDLEDFIIKLATAQKQDKYINLNFYTYNNKLNTIEFRPANGTIDPNTWIENIKLFGRIIELADILANYNRDNLTIDQQKKLILKEKLSTTTKNIEKLEILLELLSFTEEEKNIYRKRYQINCQLLKDLTEEENPLNKISFSKIPFKSEEKITNNTKKHH